MINIKKISDEKYVAFIDFNTFESYGLSVTNIEEESFANIENLINDITKEIYSEYKDILGDYCDVGILIEHESVVVSIVKSSEEAFFENDEFDMDVFEGIEGIENIENHVVTPINNNSNSNTLNFFEDNLNPGKGLSTNDALYTEEDFSEGLVVEFSDIESFIKLLKPLSKVLSKEEKISLYYSNFDNVYYLLLSKTEKLAGLFNKYTVDIEDEEIRLEVEYEFAEDIYMEYLKIKSFFTERGLESTKTLGYLEEFCDVIYDSGSVKKLARIFK